MAKKTTARFKNKSTGLAAYIGRALGKLAAKRDTLARQLAGIEQEIESVRKSVGGFTEPRVAPAQATRPAVGKKRAPLSEASRRKMADAAKARWAAAKKAGRTRLG